MIKLGRTKPKKTAKWGRDFIMVDTEKSGPAASLQVQMKKHPNRGVVEFKKIPKLKYTKDVEAKFKLILRYRIQQCAYICSFQEEEESLGRILESSEASAVDGGAVDLHFITMHRTQRKQQRTTSSYEMNELLQRSRSGAKASGLKEKRKKKPKLRSKDPELNARHIKAEVLEQIINYITTISGYKPYLDDTILSNLIETISVNLFIPSATKQFVPPLRLKAGSGRFLCDPVDVPRACWAHRSKIYNIILHLAISFNEGQGPPGDQKLSSERHELFRAHVGGDLINHLASGLQSQDLLEREMIVSCFMVLSDQCPYTRPFIWKEAKQALLEFSSDGKWDTSRAATQVVSLIEFVESSEGAIDHDFVKDALLPLYKAPFEVIVRYHPTLLKFMTKLVSSDHSLIKPLVNRLIACWPVQSASKQLLFLEQVSAIFLEIVVRAGAAAGGQGSVKPQDQWKYTEEDTAILMDVHHKLFCRVCNCLEGEHYEVSVAAIRILDHPAVFFPFVLCPSNVAPVEEQPDGTTPARSHPVLSIIYRSFRRVVETHDYTEVRKTINTLMGLLEDHWGDVCEKEILDEEARQASRAKRRVDVDTIFESVKQAAPQHLEHVHTQRKARQTDPELDLDAFEHLRFRGQTVSAILDSTGPRRRALTVNDGIRPQISKVLTKEAHRRMKTLEGPASGEWNLDAPTKGRSRAISTPTGRAEHPRKRRGSFELFLANVSEEEAKRNSKSNLGGEASGDKKGIIKYESQNSDDSEDGGEIDEDEAEELERESGTVKRRMISLPVGLSSRESN